MQYRKSIIKVLTNKNIDTRSPVKSAMNEIISRITSVKSLGVYISTDKF